MRTSFSFSKDCSFVILQGMGLTSISVVKSTQGARLSHM